MLGYLPVRTKSMMIPSTFVFQSDSDTVGSAGGKLYAVNPDRSFKWSYATGDDVNSSPAIASDETIYFPSADKKLYAINPDGSFKWMFDTSGAIGSSPVIGADGTLYVGSGTNPLSNKFKRLSCHFSMSQRNICKLKSMLAALGF